MLQVMVCASLRTYKASTSKHSSNPSKEREQAFAKYTMVKKRDQESLCVWFDLAIKETPSGPVGLVLPFSLSDPNEPLIRIGGVTHIAKGHLNPPSLSYLTTN
jgi:hypothetical protein